MREFAHWIALLPMVALIPMVAVALFGGADMKAFRLLRDQAILATAIAMSLVGDANTQWHLWAPFQIIVACIATVREWTYKRVVGGVLVSVVALALHGGVSERDSILWLVGGIGLLALSWAGELRWPVFAYFGAGGVAFYIWMDRYSGSATDLIVFHSDMLRYHGCRIVGILLMTILIVRPLYRGGV